jgi:glutaredoxin-like protein
MNEYRLPNEQMVKREFEKLTGEVFLSLFTPATKDANYSPIVEYINKIVHLSPKIKLKIVPKGSNPELFTQYHITEVPSLIIENSGIQYTGIPAGPEAMVFIQTIVMKSTANSGIGDAISRVLASLTRKLQLRTIITSQCTICPLAVRIGNMFSLESALKGHNKIRHEIIDASEHCDYVSKFDVSAVPIILINDQTAFTGIPDVDKYVEKILKEGKEG